MTQDLKPTTKPPALTTGKSSLTTKTYTPTARQKQMTSALMNMNNRSMTQTALLFDLESTGLLRQGSQLHCIVARDLSHIDKPLVWDAPNQQPRPWRRTTSPR